MWYTTQIYWVATCSFFYEPFIKCNKTCCASCYVEFRGKCGIQSERERLASNRRTKAFINGKPRKKKRAANCNWDRFYSRDNNEVEFIRSTEFLLSQRRDTPRSKDTASRLREEKVLGTKGRQMT